MRVALTNYYKQSLIFSKKFTIWVEHDKILM